LILAGTGPDSYRFDTGPTVLTMPALIEDCFAAVGRQLSDYLQLDPVSPVYQARYADGSSLDVLSDPEEMATQIAQVIGPDEAAGYERYVAFVRRLFELEMKDFIDTNFDSPADLLTTSLAGIVALGGMGRLLPAVESYLADDRLRRIYSFQSMYAGVVPSQALALYAVISYMDSVAGVFFPRGGMHALPEAMARAATDAGVTIRYGAEVAQLVRTGNRARAVQLVDGERIDCDALVLTVDLPVARRTLLDDPIRRDLRYSPSCWLMLAGGDFDWPQPPRHHTVVFGRAWEQSLEELDSGRLMTDPSLLISTPTVSDPALAPSGRHCVSVLSPTPHLGRYRSQRRVDADSATATSSQDWGRIGGYYRQHILSVLAARGFGGFDAAEVEHVLTPVDWLARGLDRGTPFALAHTFSQTGPFRPRNRWGENVVLAGSGTVPGVGVPMVLISGRLAAERITGPVPGYRSLAWP
jgi:phytoene desaturase